MSDLKMISRRNFLGKGMVLTSVTAGIGWAKGLQALVSPTPAQTEGPFYPDMNADLTQVKGASKKALGQVIYLQGRVVDPNERLLKGARVEIWQACASGKYDSPGDPNPAKLDPNFQYWGKTITDAQGEFLFKTIKPGSYPATEAWERPPHIHVKVFALGFMDLTTQMYFEGEALNEKDLILQQLSESEKKNVIVKFKPATSPMESGSLSGFFSIVMKPV